MSTLFDSEVNARRQGNDYLKPDLWYMLKVILSERDGEATVTLAVRPSVSSRFWWTITWPAEDGTRRSVSSERLDLAVWRAIVVEERAARARAGGLPR